MQWSNIPDAIALFMVSGYTTIPLFWLTMHPFVERWRKRGRRAYWLILPLWAVLILGLFAVLFHFRSFHVYQRWLSWIPGGLLLLTGLVVMRKASTNFSRVQITGLAELEPERHRQELIVSGIRSRLRHPIYLAHLCEMSGWCIGSGLLAAYALLPVAIVLGALMLRSEERELETRFGDVYRTYQNQVPAIIPRFSR
jgi:protein-S-isoprenylcysteine O-methyltransferase Ste14